MRHLNCVLAYFVYFAVTNYYNLNSSPIWQVLGNLALDYNSEVDDDGWHNMDVDEVVAEFGILGGEEKRHYLTTVMTPRDDDSLSCVQFSPRIGS